MFFQIFKFLTINQGQNGYASLHLTSMKVTAIAAALSLNFTELCKAIPAILRDNLTHASACAFSPLASKYRRSISS